MACATRAPPWTSLRIPSTDCTETDRSSWRTGSHPHARMPITLPAASRLPLVTIGTACADSMSARATQSPLQMPDIRLHALPTRHPYRSGSWLSGRVHIRGVRPQQHQSLASARVHNEQRTTTRRLLPSSATQHFELLHRASRNRFPNSASHAPAREETTESLHFPTAVRAR